MWKFIKETFKSYKALVVKDILSDTIGYGIPETAAIDNSNIKSFTKTQDAIGRAKKARQLILHSCLPEKDRLQIADEILYLTDDLRELQTLILMEM